MSWSSVKWRLVTRLLGLGPVPGPEDRGKSAMHVLAFAFSELQLPAGRALTGPGRRG